MKSLFFILMMVFGSATLLEAQSILKVRLTDRSPLTVTIDDRKYNKVNSVLTFGDLPSGRHYVRVYKYRAYADGKGGKAELVYQGSVRTKQYELTYLVVDPKSGKASIYNKDIDEPVVLEDRNTRRDNDRDRDRKNYSRNSFSQQDMNDLQARVNDRITDSEKQKLMQSVLGSRSYTTEQVRAMLGWLSFESTRLEFAKWAYDGVSDRRDYWKLESEFTFSSSKDEFSQYITSRN